MRKSFLSNKMDAAVIPGPGVLLYNRACKQKQIKRQVLKGELDYERYDETDGDGGSKEE
jgi:hypothetical protein